MVTYELNAIQQRGHCNKVQVSLAIRGLHSREINLESANSKTVKLGQNQAKTVFFPSYLRFFPVFWSANNEGRLCCILHILMQVQMGKGVCQSI